MEFGGVKKTSLIDFPGRPSTILFTPGCNLRCPYCHNWRLVLEPRGPFLSEETVLEILRSRKKYVDAVVVSGGEPTIHLDLPAFLKRLKTEGFSIKIDTNGFFPSVLEECLPHADYVALDVKTTLEKYSLLGAKNTDDYLDSVKMLKKGKTDYEFRATVVPGFFDEGAVHGVGELVKGARLFAFQQFVPDDTLDRAFKNVEPYPRERVARFAGMMERYVDKTIIRA